MPTFARIKKDIRMYTVILWMLAGIAAGYFLRRWRTDWPGHAVNILIWGLLFLLGIEVGANGELMRSLPTLGLEAALLAAGGTLGSAVAARALWTKLAGKAKGRPDAGRTEEGSTARALRGSGIIVGFFIAGVCAGLFDWTPRALMTGEVSFYTLCALMGCVGMSIGHSPETLRSFRSLNPRLAWLPVLTVVGTWAGSAAAGLALDHRSLADCLAVGSGFGYYSLSGIFITEYRGAELGTVALLANIVRELITLLAAPLLVRWFGRLAPIAAGGATTADTTLPVITQTSGRDLAVVSIFHGFVVDFSVPFLVTLWCSI